MSAELERRIRDLEETVGTLASWLWSAQTGFGERDARGIWKLIDEARERYNPSAVAAGQRDRQPT